jgi:hypothetical protein
MESLPSASGERIDLLIPGFKARFYNPPSPWHLVIHTRDCQKNWVAYDPWADPITARTPSTIVYEKKGYRIMNVRKADKYWIYCLTPLADGDMWVSPIFLNSKDLANEMGRMKAIEQVEWMSSISGFYEPFLGWLPAQIQDFLSDKLYFNSTDASRHNAILEIIAGIYIGFAYSDTPACIWMGAVLVLAGFARWAHVFASGEPCGQLFLEGAYRILFFLWPGSLKEPLLK